MKLNRKLDPQIEKHLSHLILAGRLTNDLDILGTPIGSPIKYGNDTEFIFYVKCLSPIPETLQEYLRYQNGIFGGFINPNYAWANKNLEQILRVDPSFEKAHFVFQLDKLKEILENKLLLFQLVQQVNRNDEVYLQVELVRIENIAPDKAYIGIPTPKFVRTREEFESALRKGGPITLAYYPWILPEPEFIYFDGYIYSSSDGSLHLESKPSEPLLYYPRNPDVLVRLEVGEFQEMVHTNYDHQLFFLSEENYQKLRELRDRLVKEGVQQQPLWPVEEITVSESAVQNTDAFDSLETPTPADELNFLQRFVRNAFRQGLYYDYEDLVNFHVCMKSNVLTIIGGMSGTGKSKLAQVYAQTLGMTFQQEVLFIPISPSYRDPSDVLGFLNPSTGVYHESETGLVSLLLKAERHPDKLFMVIFDEMNLSHVEHWFSPFISVLELAEDRRQFSLYPQRAFCVNEHYRPTVKIGKNVLFVGTVNLDETTKEFSNRLLDRANVVFPKKMPFYRVKKEILAGGAELSSHEDEPMAISAGIYREKWCKEVDPFAVLTDHELQFLDRLHELLNETDSQRGVSFRMVRGIAKFLANIPKDEQGAPLLSRERAWDFQIQQRVLTKVRGMEAAIAPLVGTYQGDTYQEGQLARLLQTEGQAVSTFEMSLATIRRKARELAVHGYAE